MLEPMPTPLASPSFAARYQPVHEPDPERLACVFDFLIRRALHAAPADEVGHQREEAMAAKCRSRRGATGHPDRPVP